MINSKQQTAHQYLLHKGFKPADTENHETIKKFNADNMLYELTACLTVTWHEEMQTLYNIIDGFLCLANFYPDGTVSWFIVRPAGKKQFLQHIVDALYIISIDAGLESLHIWGIEERFLGEYRHIKGYRMETGYSDAMSEYVYSADSLLDLRGSANEEKRRQLRKFINKSNITLLPITKENVGICIDIENQWCNSQDCSLCRSFAGCSKNTLEIMACLFDDSVYKGVLGYIDGVPAGYSIFENVNEDISYFYFVKTTVSNFSVYLYYTCVQHYMHNAVKINLGADLGIQGLRLFKKRLGMYELQKKYICVFTKEG